MGGWSALFDIHALCHTQALVEWYALGPRLDAASASDGLGALRVKLKFTHDAVLPAAGYRDLSTLLVQSNSDPNIEASPVFLVRLLLSTSLCPPTLPFVLLATRSQPRFYQSPTQSRRHRC